MPLNVFSGCSLISLYPIVLFGFLLLVLIWWRFVPRPIVPRRDLGPCVCSRHVIVPLGARWCLSACGWNYIDTSLCNVGIVFPLPLFFKGVGPWGSKNVNGVFYMGVYKRPLICIASCIMQLKNNKQLEREWTWAKTFPDTNDSYSQLKRIRSFQKHPWFNPF